MDKRNKRLKKKFLSFFYLLSFGASGARWSICTLRKDINIIFTYSTLPQQDIIVAIQLKQTVKPTCSPFIPGAPHSPSSPWRTSQIKTEASEAYSKHLSNLTTGCMSLSIGFHMSRSQSPKEINTNSQHILFSYVEECEEYLHDISILVFDNHHK